MCLQYLTPKKALSVKNGGLPPPMIDDPRFHDLLLRMNLGP